MITKRQYKILSFFLTRSLFFGLGISNVFYHAQNDAWLCGIIGMIWGLGILSFIYYLRKNVPTFTNFLKKGVIGFICKLLLFLLALFCLHDVIISLTTMTSSFLLPLTPPLIIALVIMIVVIYGNLKGVRSFAKVAEILMPIAVVIFLFKFISGLFISDYNNFLPFMYNNQVGIIKGSLIFMLFSVTPSFLLLTIDDMKLSYKDTVSGYLWGSITITLTLFVVMGMIGPTLATTFRYPEYMSLKKIRVFNFIENIENILTFTWLFDLIVLGYTSAYNIKKLINITIKNNKITKILYLIFLALIVWVGVNIFGKYYNFTLNLYQCEPFILGGFILVICIFLFILKIIIKHKKTLSN